ncbi:MAG: M3 family metallopeptidase [Myxococcota bacterium]
MTSRSSDTSTQNPLLDASGLPRFDVIGPEHVTAAIGSLLAQLEADLSTLEATLHAASTRETVATTWEGLIVPLAEIGDRLGFSWGIVGHLMGVRNSDELREVHESAQPDVVKFGTRLAQSPEIYRGLVALREGDEWERLDASQRRIVEVLIRDVRLSGVGLEGADKERFNAIQVDLAELATEFSNHVLDGTKAFALELTTQDEVAGLPASARALAAQAARAEGHEAASAETGPWRVTLDEPSLVPFLQHATRRDLRELLYRANISIASSGLLNNAGLIARILELRLEQAKLLGFDNFAQLSLASKMAPDVAAVEQLLEEMRIASYDAASRELDQLREFARESGADPADGLRHWDILFWAERLREARFDYTDEELRPHFSLERVLDGLFGLSRRLFGVQIDTADGETPVWHEDVRFFRVRDEAGQLIAAFFLDPYSRPSEKRGGAWMDECVGRARRLNGVRLPVAYLVCNQTPPVGDKPSLMTFREVETLFHEFGHGLQHMLTTVDEALAAGIRNVEWDAVELPSQFMENWCYDRETLMGLAVHYETGEPLPDELFDKITSARTYRAGSDTLRQVFFGLTDLEIHSRFVPGAKENAFDVERRVAERATVMAPLPDDRFLCKFGHIFGGGYAAGYYSYKWAEVLSADAFAAFEEVGLGNEEAVRTTGRRFRDTVLGLGGSQPAMETFVAFRGREPSTEALLRHSGLREGG